MERKILQVAAGNSKRNYRDRFLEFDLAAIGPGGPGRWVGNGTPYEGGDRTAIRALVEARPGDIVIMTVGYQIETIGRVEEGYDHNEGLGLVGGWDLFHYLRVKWARIGDHDVLQARNELGDPPKLRIRRRACRVGGGSHEAIEWARRLDRALEETGYWSSRELEDLPPDDAELSLDQVREWIDPAVQDDVVAVLETASVLWGDIHKRRWRWIPSESEAVSLIVVPFLRALGWKPSQIACEWKWLDVSCFDGIDREEEACRLIVEAKRPGDGLLWAQGQAYDYAKQRGLRTPIVTTNGFYWAFYESHDRDKPDGEVFLPHIYESSREFFANLDQVMPARL